MDKHNAQLVSPRQRGGADIVARLLPTPRSIAVLLPLFLCLLAPSVWLLSTVPPLWRDLDAYTQLTASPAHATAGGHGPLYCIAVRLPLYMGAVLERRSFDMSSVGSNGVSFFLHPVLTNSGILLLIVLQHLCFCAAALRLIAAASCCFVIRLCLTIIWTSNPLLYTFAHSVGSESISLVCTLLVVASGLRLVRHSNEIGWKSWYVFGIALWLCFTVRYVNILLGLLLPLTFIASAISLRMRRLAHGGVSSVGVSVPSNLQRAAIALLIAVACLVVANNSARQLCKSERLNYHPRFGFTFLWRLRFIETLPRERRSALLQKVALRTSSRDVKSVLFTIEQVANEEHGLRVDVIMPRIQEALFGTGTRPNWLKFDAVLNEMARAFLSPPTAEHLAAVRMDLNTGMEMPIHESRGFYSRQRRTIFRTPRRCRRVAT